MDLNSKIEKQDEIRVLEFPENIRQKFGMYIDSPDTMLREIVDNSTDEVLSCKTCNSIFIDTDFNGYNIVCDNGRGISISESKDRPGQTQADVSISVMHAGSKFTNTDSKVGTFGIGSSAVNALSENYILMSRVTPENYKNSMTNIREFFETLGPRSRREIFYIVWYKKGYKYYEGVHKKSDIEQNVFGQSCPKGYRAIPEGYSTIVMFQVDSEIFPKVKTSLPKNNILNFLLIQEKFYKKKVSIIANGELIESSGFQPYKYEILKTIVPADNSKNPQLGVYVTFEVDSVMGQKNCTGTVNGLTTETGVHISYIEQCFEQALISEYKLKHKIIFPGFKMFVILLAEDLVYGDQVKTRLKQITKVKQTDFLEITKEFIKVFRRDQGYWDDHIARLNFLAESMRSVSAVEKAQKMIESTTGNQVYKIKQEYVEGFSDATAPAGNRWGCELYLCEGLSAAGGLKQGRKSTQYHAVLPLRGKILNVKDSSVDEALANKEIFTLLRVIGLGLDVNNVTTNCSTPEESYKMIQKYSRYSKICIATDSDSDGSHIQILLLYLFSKYARFLIDYGMLYISMSPLFEQNGNYFYPNDPLQPGTVFPVGLDTTKHFRRFKGLGSIPKDLVYDAFYNPTTRRLVQVTPEGIDYFMSLVEDVDMRKKLLINSGIISNPYNLND